MNNRRRVLYGSKEELIERPDCIRVDFTTATDNFVTQIGYFAKFTLAELDGESITVSGNGTHEPKITIPNAGTHTLYLKVSEYNSVYFRFNIDYLRLPYNIESKHNSNGGGISKRSQHRWHNIDILDTSKVTIFQNNTWNAGESAIRVPIGSKQLYPTTSNVYNDITEYNFKYNIE